ncbi:DNA-binding NarL/FixJ family response regulator [Rhodococcus sp. PvR044]|uniref:response regulator transcription factor n=1 Tax=unclassified Rhodococcus (in: high G+C Gram-positive bacteria) TaxID=192944 RepID=UPI00117B69EB|nr:MULTISPECIES: response regulator transcription factor [unclassified Rhodococcus (in: high G+C Gram-positive bacteria)]
MGSLLAEARRLLDHAIDEHHSVRSAAGDVVRLRPGEGWERDLQQLLQRVRKEAMLAVASPLRIQRHYQPGRRTVADMLSTGKEVRLLYTQHYAETRDYESLRQQPELCDRIRVSNADFHNMVIIDRQVAAVWGGTGEQRPYGYVISDPDLLRVLHQFAMVLWESAPGLSRHFTLPQPEFAQMTLAVLRALDLGLKDELAARRLAVSLRTYRRYVADIMVRLGVTTRFQVGARAAELGLLKAFSEQ